MNRLLFLSATFLLSLHDGAKSEIAYRAITIEELPDRVKAAP